VILAGIVVEGRLKELGKVFGIINLYGPYGDRKPFWEGLGDYGCIFSDNSIIIGDLDLTLD